MPEIQIVNLDRAAQLFAEQTEIDFGEVQPNVFATHEITVFNRGKEPLSLKRFDQQISIDVTPKGELSILPGESCQLQIRWKPEVDFKEKSRASVKFRTNDPKLSVFNIHVSGQVRSSIVVLPPTLRAPRAKPNRRTEMETLISSQRWENFEVSEVTANLPGLDWHFEPAETDLLRAINAKSGWVLHASLPADLPAGKLVGKMISLTVQPQDGASGSESLQIPIEAKVLRRLAVYGEGIDENGAIHLGTLAVGVEHKVNLSAKIYDKLPHLVLREIKASPDFIQVQFAPYKDPTAPKNLYRLQITIPASAPLGIYQGSRSGKLRLEFEHPRIAELELDLNFVLFHRRNNFSTSSPGTQE